MTQPARSRVAGAGAALATLGLAATTGIAVIRFTGIQERGYRMMGVAGASVAFTGCAAAATLLGAVLVLVARSPARWRGAWPVLLAAALPVLLLVQMTAPALTGALFPERVTEGERLSVLAQNLYFQNGDVGATLAAVVAREPDVLVLTEFTPEAAALVERGPLARKIDDAYPHQWRQPEPEGGGLAVLSSVPFDRAVRVPLSAPAVVLQLRVGGERVDLYALHPMAPSDRWGLRQWQHDYRVLTSDAADSSPLTIMAGDFNANTGHRAFRRLLDVGDLRDAHDVGGGGLAATWPSGQLLPPLMRLDHVLVGEGIGVERFEVLGDLGSDHRGVEAWLRVPRS